MVKIDILLRGIPGRTDEGYLGQSSVVLLNGETIIDTGGQTRRLQLERSLAAAGVKPEEIEHVLLTHLHFDHCDNVDLFPNAEIFVYSPELNRIKNGDLDWATSRSFEALTQNQTVTQFKEDEHEIVDGVIASHTPGHSEHHVSYIIEADRTYGFVGDAINNIREFVTREPTTLYDNAVARETTNTLADRLDFIIPGHDVPFFVAADGSVTPCGDVELTVGLDVESDTEEKVRLASTRPETRALPNNVVDVSVRQALD